MVELIKKKRDGHILTNEEIKSIISGYIDGKIPDYQVSAFLMAVFFKGMNEIQNIQSKIILNRIGQT